MMGGGTIVGALWGVIVAGVVLAAVSLSTPLPPRPDAIPQVMDAPATVSRAPDAQSVSAPVDAAPMPEGAGFTRVPPQGDAAQAAADVPVGQTQDGTADAGTAFETAPAPAASISTPPVAPALQDGGADAPGSRLPQIAAAPAGEAAPAPAPRRLTVPETSTAPEATDATAPATPAQVAVPRDDAPSVADLPAIPTPIQTGSDAPGPAAADADAPATPRLPQVAAIAPPQAPATSSAPEPPVDPAPGTPPVASGEALPQVVTEAPRLPQVGTEDSGVAVSPAETAAPADTVATGPNALRDNAAPFDATEDRPLMAVILIDDPEGGLAPDMLTRFTFPVAFALDPLAPDAPARAAAYRAAGFEVVILADILPDGATPADAEVALAAAQALMPQAVAVLDTPGSRIQGDRPILDATVAALAETGHGLVAFPRGLNAAEQSAARADVPAATVFRLLDDEDQRATVITRFLARAGFAATSEGAAIVVGRTRPDTVTALFSWALGSRSEAVAIAPLSAVLLRGAQ